METRQCCNPHGLQWAIRGTNLFQICGQTTERLPAGSYTCFVDHCGTPNFQLRELRVDDLIDFPGSLSHRILTEIELFWSHRERFRQFGFLHRRGYLFWGKQGCGKSSLIHQIVARVIGAGHVAFFCTEPHGFIACLTQFRQVEPDRPVVCVFEDIDAIIRYYTDAELLQWLDGNYQVDQAVNLASTNYPERLDRRIIARPRRFDRVLEIGMPDVRFREAYFTRKLPQLAAEDLRRWVEATEGLPYAALAELIISVCCLGNELEESARYLRELDNHHPSSTQAEQNGHAEPTPVGINGVPLEAND